jgi:hypothetical protein
MCHGALSLAQKRAWDLMREHTEFESEAPVHAPPAYASAATRLPVRGPSIEEEVDELIGPAHWPVQLRRKAANPELLLVGNNPGIGREIRMWAKNKGGSNVRRRRRKGRNMPLTVRLGGRRHTFRALVKKFGVKGALKKWRGKKKFHGYKRRGRVYNRRKRRSRNRSRRSFRGRRRKSRRK